MKYLQSLFIKHPLTNKKMLTEDVQPRKVLQLCLELLQQHPNVAEACCLWRVACLCIVGRQAVAK